jgi:hypothetical protein
LFFISFLGELALASATYVEFHKGRLLMESFVETNLEPRKEWAAPELKKIDIEQITAAGGSNFSDGVGNAS